MNAKQLLFLVVLGAVGYFGYQYYLQGPGSADTANVKASHKKLTQAIASANTGLIESLVSPKFSDKKMNKRADFIKVLTIPRKSYSTSIIDIRMQGQDLAMVYYNRTEVRGDKGKLLSEQVKGEVWTRNPANPADWKLEKLAADDKWFRSMDIPVEVAKQGKQAKPGEAVPPGELPELPDPSKAKTAGKPEDSEFVKDQGMGEGEQLAMTEQLPGKRYSSMGKRDPFKPSFEPDDKDDVGLCDRDRTKEPLENYELLALKLTGVILMEAGELALVSDPSGKGYTVRKNMYMGKDCGRVIGIEEDQIIILEKKKDPLDPFKDWEQVENTLKLRPEEGT